MSTLVAPTAATPSDGSLERAAQAFAGLLSDSLDSESSETQTPPSRPPEQRATPKAATPKAKPAQQAQAAPAADDTGDESESARPANPDDPAQAQDPDAAQNATDQQDPQDAETDANAEEQPDTQRFAVKIDGKEELVTLDELRAGYSRQKDYTTKTMALAKERKEFQERELSAVRQEREQYRASLSELEQALQAMTPTEPDWATLAQQVAPEQFTAEVVAWNTNKERLTAVQAERQRVETQQAEDARKALTNHIEAERTRLIEADPDFGDPTKSPALQQEIQAYAKSLGYTEEDLSQVVDHRLVLILRDALRYRQMKAKQPSVQNRIQETIATTPPGASRGNAPRPNKGEQALQRLKTSGSIDDAASAFLDRL